MAAIKDTQELADWKSIWDYTLVKDHLYALRKAVRKRLEKKEIS